MPNLFEPIRVGALVAPNRIFMAPLTRGRATRGHVPTALMAEYYAQRAGAGLIISEATGISRQGLGWPFAPGLWQTRQIKAWAKVTEAVHAAGGRIVAQLWHMGRVVHPSYLGGAPPVSASQTTAPGHAHTYAGRQAYAQAHALTIPQLRTVKSSYRKAAEAAISAGFDGVQIHAANGYLLDQFLRDEVNLRQDAYGGSMENRIRLLREVIEGVSEAVGVDKISVRISPNGALQGVDDSNPEALFPELAKTLSALGIAFLEIREPPVDGTFGRAVRPPLAPAIRASFTGPLVLNSDYDFDRATQALWSGAADAISFGRPFIANPDLPAMLETRSALNRDDMSTWYTRGRKGYVV